MSDLERRVIQQFAAAGMALAATKTNAMNCKFRGCTCGAASDFAEKYGDFNRLRHQVNALLVTPKGTSNGE